MIFKHLNVPDGWERYFTKYPQGMTILEALFEWVSQVDNMVDNQNELSTNVEQFRNEIDAFVERFDERLQTEVTQVLTDWQNSGFLDVVISEALQWQLTDYIATNEADKLSLTAQLQQNTNFVSIKKYNNDLYLALENEDFVLIPEGQFTTTPIPTSLLDGKTIKGIGKQSILYFEGDVVCFDMSSQHTVISNLTILVDKENMSDVIRLSDSVNRAFDNIIEDVDIALIDNYGVYKGYSDQVQGNYTGLRLFSTHRGVYRTTVKNLNIDMPKNGVILEDNSDTSWVTHNNFTDVYIFGYSNIGFGFLETNSLLLNTVSNLRLDDASKVTTERTALNLSGFGNVINNMQMFKDQQEAVSYTINFDSESKRVEKNFITGGHLEGYIKNEHLMKDNYVLITNTKKHNQVFYHQPYQNFQSTPNNIIDNTTFEYGVGNWTTNGTASVISTPDNRKVGRNNIKVTGTGTLNFNYSLHAKDLLKGKTITFTACVKTTSKDLLVLIDEGGSVGFERGAYHTGSDEYEILTVTKKIDGSGSMVRLQILDGSAAPEKTFEVAWINVSYGIFTPLHPLAEKVFYRHKNKGLAIIPSGETTAVVNHGLDVTPKTEDIVLTGDYFFGASECTKCWVTSITSTSFTINVDVAPSNKAQFGWKVNMQ